MTDVEDIILYIKALKKGFDKNEFNEKIEELAQIVDNIGLDYEDFHTLFKIWLNLNIPVTKWMTVGLCLIPRDRVEARTVEYALRWLLANYQNQTSFSRIGFLLDWLTAAMDTDSIDLEALDSGYEVFYMLISYEILTPHVMKLVYTLTKPENVTRRQVIELMDIAKKRDAKKSKCRQIQVLLGLFKSYKPECVPESVPAFSVHIAFRKLNVQLLSRFGRSQGHRNSTNEKKQRLIWVNPLNMKNGKKADPLIPNMEFFNVGSKQYANKDSEKNHFDFSEPAALIGYSLQSGLRRPARLRALLCNEAGLALLATASDTQHAFLSHDLRHLLNDCFLHSSPYCYEEKQDLLRRLATLQRTLMQGIPVVTWFLAQFLPLWNEKDYFHEILDLVEWISVDNPSHVPYILRPLGSVYHRAQPLEQCAILKCLVNSYDNLAYASTRRRHYFMNMEPSRHYGQLLASLSTFIGDICNTALQVNPDDIRPLYWSLWTTERVSTSQLRSSLPPAPPQGLLLALPVLTAYAVCLDKLLAILLLYKKIFGKLKRASKTNRKTVDQLWTFETFTVDLVNCMWGEKVLSERKNGLIFSKLHPQLVEKLFKSIPDVDGALSLRSHVAFAPYTYTQLEALDYKETDNKLWFDTVIEQEFTNLGRFLKSFLR